MSRENTREKQGGHEPWKPGESGNPAGRPKGSRNKLGEAFIQDVYVKWQEQGESALIRMIEQEPGAFVRVVAGILPKELIVKDELSEVSDEELAALVAAAREALGNRADGGGDAPAKGRAKQAKGVQTLQ